MNRDEEDKVAMFLASAYNSYHKQQLWRFEDEWRDEEIVRLGRFNLIGYAAIAEIIGTTPRVVERVLRDEDHAPVRGALNPAHLPMLSYILGDRDMLSTAWAQTMVNNGTDISTIAGLTGISRSTVERRVKGDEDD